MDQLEQKELQEEKISVTEEVKNRLVVRIYTNSDGVSRVLKENEEAPPYWTYESEEEEIPPPEEPKTQEIIPSPSQESPQQQIPNTSSESVTTNTEKLSPKPSPKPKTSTPVTKKPPNSQNSGEKKLVLQMKKDQHGVRRLIEKTDSEPTKKKSTSQKKGKKQPPKMIVENVSHDWEVKKIEELIEDQTTNFERAPTIEFKDISESIVIDYLFNKGLPLVVRNVTEQWNREMFSWNWLREKYGDTQLIDSPRDISTFINQTGWTIQKYVDYFLQEPQQRNPANLYGKDISCPSEWEEYVAEKIPSYLTYRGERDLNIHLPPSLAPVSLMIYVGFEGNLTPGHYDIAGSLGHNLITYAEKDACAVWFCAASSDRENVAKFWSEKSPNPDASIDHDNYFMPLEKLLTAPFKFHIIIQKEGDLVLLPPLCAHQVINKNGRSIKVSWNSITAQSIPKSYESLPLFRRVVKPEIYKIKTLVYFSLKKLTQMVKDNKPESLKHLLEQLPQLLQTYEDIIWTEKIDLNQKTILFSPQTKEIKVGTFDDKQEHIRRCDICKCDLWNRCFHCSKCTNKDFDVCIDCVARGRGCGVHRLDLDLMEYLSEEAVQKTYDEALEAYQTLISFFGEENKQPVVTQRDEKSVSMATIAYTKVLLNKEDKEKVMCHQCKRPKFKKDHSICSDCQKKFCEYCLWNRYGIKALDFQQFSKWTCLACQKICNCAVCLRERKEEAPPTFDFKSKIHPLSHVAVELPDNLTESGAITDFAPNPRPPSKPREQKKRKIVSAKVEETKKKVKKDNQEQNQKPKISKPGKFCCSACGKKGATVECQSCLKKFHDTKECGFTMESDDSYWHCLDCTNQVCWVKIPQHPDWPARIINENQIEQKYKKAMKKCKQKNSEVVAYFFGDNKYSWVKKQNVSQFDQGYAEKVKEGIRHKLKTLFHEALTIAEEWKNATPPKYKESENKDLEDQTESAEENENSKEEKNETSSPKSKTPKKPKTKKRSSEELPPATEESEENKQKKVQQSPLLGTHVTSAKVVHSRRERVPKPNPAYFS